MIVPSSHLLPTETPIVEGKFRISSGQPSQFLVSMASTYYSLPLQIVMYLNSYNQLQKPFLAWYIFQIFHGNSVSPAKAMTRPPNGQALQLQAAFFQWHRARRCADRCALQELRAATAEATAATTTAGRLVEVAKVKAYLHSVAWAM